MRPSSAVSNASFICEHLLVLYMQKRRCQGATRNPNRNETNMTNDSKVLPHKLNSRSLRIVRATMGVMTLIVLTFPFVRAKSNEGHHAHGCSNNPKGSR